MTAKSRQRKQLKKTHHTHQVVISIPATDDAPAKFERESCDCDKGNTHFKENN